MIPQSRLSKEVIAYLQQVEHNPGWHVKNKGYPASVTPNAIVFRSVSQHYPVSDWPYRSSYAKYGSTWHAVAERVPYGDWDDCFHELPMPRTAQTLVTIFEPRLYDNHPSLHTGRVPQQHAMLIHIWHTTSDMANQTRDNGEKHCEKQLHSASLRLDNLCC